MIEFCQWDSIGSAVGDCDFPTSLQNIQVCSTGLEKIILSGSRVNFLWTMANLFLFSKG